MTIGLFHLALYLPYPYQKLNFLYLQLSDDDEY